MKILFDKNGNPLSPSIVRKSINSFGKSYNATVQKVISHSARGMDKDIFFQNVAVLMPNFKMTRSGPFKGIRYASGRVVDPRGQIAACWNAVGTDAVQTRRTLVQHVGSRRRKA
jgi:hypothetical protein